MPQVGVVHHRNLEKGRPLSEPLLDCLIPSFSRLDSCFFSRLRLRPPRVSHPNDIDGLDGLEGLKKRGEEDFWVCLWEGDVFCPPAILAASFLLACTFQWEEKLLSDKFFIALLSALSTNPGCHASFYWSGRPFVAEDTKPSMLLLLSNTAFCC